MIQETPEGVAQPEFQGPSTESWTDHEAQNSPGEADETASAAPGRSELEDLAVEAEHLVRDCIDQTERRIRRHPLAAVGVAAGVGLLVGLMCGRGR